jgi:hypothetical protein
MAVTAEKGAAASYTPKDVLVLKSYRECCSADAAGGGRNAACSSKKGVAAGARYLEGTFGHHLTQRCWEAAPSTVKL